MKINNFEAVAFDFDGTLADTRHTHDSARLEAFDLMAAETGDERYVTVPEEIHQTAHQHGSNPYDIIGWVLKEQGIVELDAICVEDDTVHAVVDIKTERYRAKAAVGIDEIPGASNFVRSIAGLDVPLRLAIATTEHRDLVLPYLDRYNLTALFDDARIVTREDVEVGSLKPDPAVYLVALARLGLGDFPDRMIAVEDTPQGVTAAKRAGACAISIATTHGLKSFFALPESERPDIYAQNYDHLSRILGIQMVL